MSDLISRQIDEIKYEIKARNGQTLEHGFTSEKKALERIKEYKRTYPNEKFSIWPYRKGKYEEEE